MTENAKVLGEHEAPYTDPGLEGQGTIDGEKSFTSTDGVAAGTPPTGTHGGTNQGNGERYASVTPDQEERAQLERDVKHTGTKDTP